MECFDTKGHASEQNVSACSPELKAIKKIRVTTSQICKKHHSASLTFLSLRCSLKNKPNCFNLNQFRRDVEKELRQVEYKCIRFQDKISRSTTK